MGVSYESRIQDAGLRMMKDPGLVRSSFRFIVLGFMV